MVPKLDVAGSSPVARSLHSMTYSAVGVNELRRRCRWSPRRSQEFVPSDVECQVYELRSVERYRANLAGLVNDPRYAVASGGPGDEDGAVTVRRRRASRMPQHYYQ